MSSKPFHLRIANPLLCILVAAVANAQPVSQPDSNGSDSIVNGTTFLLARIDTSAITLDDVAEAFGDDTIHVAIDLPYSLTQPVFRIDSHEEIPDGVEWLRRHASWIRLGDGRRAGDRWRTEFSVGSKPDLDNRIGESVLPADRPELMTAFAEAGDGPVVVAVAFPNYFSDLFTRLVPTLPESLGGGETSVLIRDVLSVAVSIDLAQAEMRAEFRTVSDEAATRFVDQMPAALKGLIVTLTGDDRIHTIAEPIRLERRGDRVLWTLDSEQLAPLGEQIVRRGAQLRAHTRAVTNVKRVGLAIHNYIDVYNSFPPNADARDDDGRPRLSWRVHLLPFLDEAELYSQFRLDEPWNSEHNRALIERIPDIYAWPDLPAGKTIVQAPVGEGTIFGGDRPIRLADITDGTSNTAMVVLTDPDRAVIWTAPDDYRFDPEQPQSELLRDEEGRAFVGVADGSVQRTSTDRPGKDWLHLFQRNDGQPVRWDR